ncbi:MAG: citrate lyase holo-[acyl-carrier protein] synthase [Oscillospiraceae bacterium]|nr:MAG: citrate lyase holo-[acyl-carrier protein] synthase [Oscillospiraceae bacterium]
MQQDEQRGVTLEEMLQARENRAAQQRAMQKCHPGALLVSFTLNIPGAVKRFPEAVRAFAEGCRRIERELSREGAVVSQRWRQQPVTGCEAIWAVRGCDPLLLKERMCAVEDGSRMGRLFDIDLIDSQGKGISRSRLGLPPRRCLLCGEPAHQCARSQAHPAEQLQAAVRRIIREEFLEQRADAVAAAACRALLYEVSATPKPGLVDRANNGSHRDMDFFTFLDSTAALVPYFGRLFLAGADAAAEQPQRLLSRVRYPGLLAQDAMFKATGGVNTHKGLVFSLGLLCAAAGYSEANGLPQDVHALLGLCGRIVSDAAQQELSRAAADGGQTHGEQIYAAAGIAGVRGEAAAGFPSVERFGLPALRKFLAQGMSLNDAGSLTLLVLLGQVDDTNMIARGGLEVWREIRKMIARRMDSPPFPDRPEIERLDREFIHRNLSPGGCADLLAMTYMLYFLEQEKESENGVFSPS